MYAKIIIIINNFSSFVFTTVQIRDRGLHLAELRRRARHPHEAPTAVLPPRPVGEIVVRRRCAVQRQSHAFLMNPLINEKERTFI